MWLAALLLACSGGEGDDTAATPSVPFELDFRAQVGDAPWACGASYAGVGTTGATIEPLYLATYLSELTVLDDAGGQGAMTVEANDHQGHGAVLLDFGDGTGGCATLGDDAATWTTVLGEVPEGDWTKIRFTLGLPASLNHLDAEDTAPPFDRPELWWGWAGGYKYLRLDLKNEAHDDWLFHHGAAGCAGSPEDGFTCDLPYLATIELPLPSEGGAITLDVGALLAGSDLLAQPDLVSDFVEGCMALPGDPECVAPFAALGLTFDSNEPGPAQTVFTSD